MIAPELIEGKGMCGLSKRIELRADEVIEGARCKRGVKMKVGWEVLNGNL